MYWDLCYAGLNHCEWYPLLQECSHYSSSGEHLEVCNTRFHAFCSVVITYDAGCYVVRRYSNGRYERRSVPRAWKFELLSVVDEAVAEAEMSKRSFFSGSARL